MLSDVLKAVSVSARVTQSQIPQLHAARDSKTKLIHNAMATEETPFIDEGCERLKA